jgi:uncharacterized protein YcbK (DUF882 family)
MSNILQDQSVIMKAPLVGRREILKFGGIAALAGLFSLSPVSKAIAARGEFGAARVSFRNSHTGESFSGVYRVGDKYLPEAFDRINYVMRDFRANEVFPMDPEAIDLIKLVHDKTGSDRPLEVLSGYRSPKTNAMLRGVSARTGVARNSLHMFGQAVDIRMSEFNSKKLYNVAKSLHAGGVGYYPKSNFVHVDTGEVRFW